MGWRSPITAPTTDETNSSIGRACQPNQAPSAPSSKVSVAHALTACHELEQPVDCPQDQIPCRCANHRVWRWAKVANRLTSKPSQKQRQRQLVGQQLGVEINAG